MAASSLLFFILLANGMMVESITFNPYTGEVASYNNYLKILKLKGCIDCLIYHKEEFGKEKTKYESCQGCYELAKSDVKFFNEMQTNI